MIVLDVYENVEEIKQKGSIKKELRLKIVESLNEKGLRM